MRLYTVHNSEVSHCSVEFIGSNRPRVIDVHHATGGSPGAVRGDGCEGGGGIGSPGHVSNGLGSPWEFRDPMELCHKLPGI
jgi:hypothetical protein